MEKYTSHARFASVHDFYVLFFVECIELTFLAQNMYYNSVCCHKICLDQIFTSLGMKSFSLNEPCNAILPAKLKRDILPAQLVPMIYLRTILPILALSIQFNFFRRRTSLLNKDTKKYVSAYMSELTPGLVYNGFAHEGNLRSISSYLKSVHTFGHHLRQVGQVPKCIRSRRFDKDSRLQLNPRIEPIREQYRNFGAKRVPKDFRQFENESKLSISIWKIQCGLNILNVMS